MKERLVIKDHLHKLVVETDDVEILLQVEAFFESLVGQAALLSPPNTNYTEMLTSCPLEMIFVDGGTFIMGSNDGWDSERHIHSVTLSSFYIGKYPITQKQWEDIMGNNPSEFQDDENCPVENVSWNDAQDFIKKLNQKFPPLGARVLQYRLLTEAEWEFAARGGNQSKGYEYAGSNDIDEVAWYGGSDIGGLVWDGCNYYEETLYAGNSCGTTQPVGLQKANELGIFDMTGNVWEWCNDWYDKDYYKNSPSHNPTGPSSGKSARVVRGGSWLDDANFCRVAYRDCHWVLRNDTVGFRVCLGY